MRRLEDVEVSNAMWRPNKYCRTAEKCHLNSMLQSMRAVASMEKSSASVDPWAFLNEDKQRHESTEKTDFRHADRKYQIQRTWINWMEAVCQSNRRLHQAAPA